MHINQIAPQQIHWHAGFELCTIFHITWGYLSHYIVRIHKIIV